MTSLIALISFFAGFACKNVIDAYFKNKKIHAMDRDYLRGEIEDPNDDSSRIRKALKKTGFNVSLAKADAIWSQYSEGSCATWLILPEKDTDIVCDSVRRVAQDYCNP